MFRSVKVSRGYGRVEVHGTGVLNRSRVPGTLVHVWDEEKVRTLARENHGLVDRATALLFGASDDVIRHQISTGRWEIVQEGVYYLNVTARTWQTDLLAAVLAGGPNARASHRSASRLWGLDGVGGRVVEVTVPYSKRPAPVGAIVHRTRRVLPSTMRSAIPVTTVERTLLDLAVFCRIGLSRRHT